jgi:YVTN family beta-propeller protein
MNCKRTCRYLLPGLLTVGVVMAQSPLLLVLEKEAASLAFVDPESGRVLGRVPVGESPHEIIASPDGKLAFVANYGSRNPGTTISVIDVPARKEIRRVDLGPLRKPHGLAFSDGKVYFTAEVNKVVGRYDPAADRVDWILGTGQNSTHMVLVSPDANTMYTANIGSDTITVIERASGQAAWNETVIPVGKGPEGFDVSPDGKQLWAAGSRDGSVSIVDLAARRVVGTIDVHTKRSNRLKFTPDGKRVLISDLEAGELVVLDAGSRSEVKRLKLGRAPEGILILPDGSRAFVAVSGDNNIAVIDLVSLQVTRRISTGAGPDGMAWIAAK